jgi:hypothetical protein
VQSAAATQQGQKLQDAAMAAHLVQRVDHHA